MLNAVATLGEWKRCAPIRTGSTDEDRTRIMAPGDSAYPHTAHRTRASLRWPERLRVRHEEPKRAGEPTATVSSHLDAVAQRHLCDLGGQWHLCDLPRVGSAGANSSVIRTSASVLRR